MPRWRGMRPARTGVTNEPTIPARLHSARSQPPTSGVRPSATMISGSQALTA